MTSDELKSYLLKEIEKTNKQVREMEELAKTANFNCRQDQMFAFYAGYKKALGELLTLV